MIKRDRNPFVDRFVRVFESEVFTHQSVLRMTWDESSRALLVRLEPPDETFFETLREVVVDKVRRESLEGQEPFRAVARQFLVNDRRNIFLKIVPDKHAA